MGSMIFGCKRRIDRVGVLLAQLGTPDAPTARALRPYLKQFLSDPRVIEKNRAVWWLILNGIVLTVRPKRSARLYSRIWTEQGSPLLVISRAQHELVTAKLQESDPDVRVALGMRYGSPSLESAVDQLIAEGCRRIVLVPLYPQYSATTTASTYDAVFKKLLEERWIPTLRVVEPYHIEEGYLDSLAARVNEYLDTCGTPPERIVLSYHGIPAAYVERGDPYCCMCTETTRALLPRLRFDSSRVIHTFQSRFGRDPWLEPYTDVTLETLAKEGIKHVAVFAPGFTADCLETLDELGNEGSHQFKSLGGERLDLIPCLNEHPRWIEALTALVRTTAGDWLTSPQAETERFACPAKLARR